MGETAKDLRKRAQALREKGNQALAEADALLARAKGLEAKGRTDLQAAILAGRKADAKRFLRAGDDPNETGEGDDRPPLVLALEASKDEGRFSASLALALVKAGADPNAKRRNGISVLAQAIKCEELEIALALLKAGANPDDPEASRSLGHHLEKVVIFEMLDDKERGVAEAIRGLLRAAPAAGEKRETL